MGKKVIPGPYAVHPGILRMGGPEDAARYLAEAPHWVDAMFESRRAPLRPLLDRLIAIARSLGPDVTVSPGKTIIPFYRKHVFAQVRPATQTRLDLGLCLRGVTASGRLVETGGEAKGDRITHRVAITTAGDIDRDVRRWLQQAYRTAG